MTGDCRCIAGRQKTICRRLMLYLLVVDWATEHRGFEVDVMVPGETVARIIGRTFLVTPDVSCQHHTLVNILCQTMCHLFHNVASPELLNGSVFLKTK